WTRVRSGTPPNYGLHGMAYDSESDRVILVAGFGCADRTWAFDFENDSWTNMGAIGLSGAPRKAVAYDSALDRVICFDSTTLAYDFNTNTWMDTGSSAPADLSWS